MNQPLLFDVPKDTPSRRERLRAFKTQHGIETHKSLNVCWLACLMPRARRFGYVVTADSDLFDCMSKVGRLLDEAEVTAYGSTELEAVKRCAEQNGIRREL